MIQLAFVGCAHIHTPGFVGTLKKRSDVKVKSVWDHNVERGKKCAGELEAEFVSDLAQVYVDSAVAGAIVCTETNLHEQVVLPGAAAKKHLFVEKPLGFAKRDAEVMRAAIERAATIFSTGYFRRGDRKVHVIKDHLAKGSFGQITRVRGSNCHSGALGRWFDTDWRWMADPKVAGVGAYGDLGTHLLDILIWLMGDVKDVTAAMSTGTNAYDGCDETGEGIIRFQNGVIGTLAAAWDDVADPVSLLISGTKGHAAIIDDKLHFKSSQVAGYEKPKIVPDAELPVAPAAGFDGWLDALVGKPAALVTPAEAAYRSAVMEALYKGAQSASWVRP